MQVLEGVLGAGSGDRQGSSAADGRRRQLRGQARSAVPDSAGRSWQTRSAPDARRARYRRGSVPRSSGWRRARAVGVGPPVERGALGVRAPSVAWRVRRGAARRTRCTASGRARPSRWRSQAGAAEQRLQRLARFIAALDELLGGQRAVVQRAGRDAGDDLAAARRSGRVPTRSCCQRAADCSATAVAGEQLRGARWCRSRPSSSVLGDQARGVRVDPSRRRSRRDRRPARTELARAGRLTSFARWSARRSGQCLAARARRDVSDSWAFSLARLSAVERVARAAPCLLSHTAPPSRAAKTR